MLDLPKTGDRKLLRVVNYLIQLAAGEGSAGTVVPFSTLTGPQQQQLQQRMMQEGSRGSGSSLAAAAAAAPCQWNVASQEATLHSAEMAMHR
jgi:hypothetical protein